MPHLIAHARPLPSSDPIVLDEGWFRVEFRDDEASFAFTSGGAPAAPSQYPAIVQRLAARLWPTVHVRDAWLALVPLGSRIVVAMLVRPEVFSFGVWVGTKPDGQPALRGLTEAELAALARALAARLALNVGRS